MEVSFVISNLCNIWRYLHWQLVTSPTGNLSEVKTANCAQIFFFLKYQLLYIRSALFRVFVNLIQHATCNFPIFFSYAIIHKVLLKVYLSIYIASLKYTKASTIYYYITTHHALIKINSLIAVS